MKKLFAVGLIMVFALSSGAQTKSQVADATLAARNAAVCDRFDLAATCTDAEVLTKWCEANNKPSGEMCVASDSRGAADKIQTLAQLFAEQQAATAALEAKRQVKARRATVSMIEIAILDPAVRAAVCKAASIAVIDCN